MADATTLGTWLRRERERRGITLSQISEQTKLSVGLLEGLETDDLSRWPGGIFRRAYSRSYATAIGLDPDLIVKRVEEAHPVKPADAVDIPSAAAAPAGAATQQAAAPPKPSSPHTRAIAATLDLLVAGAIGLGFAAAGSRLLWPVLAIAAYHALGLLLSGHSPMLALVAEQDVPIPTPVRVEPEQPPAPVRLDRAVTAARGSNRPHRHVSRRAARAARRA